MSEWLIAISQGVALGVLVAALQEIRRQRHRAEIFKRAMYMALYSGIYNALASEAVAIWPEELNGAKQTRPYH